MGIISIVRPIRQNETPPQLAWFKIRIKFKISVKRRHLFAAVTPDKHTQSSDLSRLKPYKCGPGYLSRYKPLATGWKVRGSNPGGGRNFSQRALGAKQPPVQCLTDFFLEGKSGRRVALTNHPHLALRLKKEYSYTCYFPSGFSRSVIRCSSITYVR
jgi:hypothetical protein